MRVLASDKRSEIVEALRKTAQGLRKLATTALERPVINISKLRSLLRHEGKS